jgi:hypothetical protein
MFFSFFPDLLALFLYRYYADVAERRLVAHSIDTGDPGYTARVVPEPCGVVGCITPWNYPLMQAVNKIAPALAAGCAVVVKPSPLASVTTLALGRLVRNPASLFRGRDEAAPSTAHECCSQVNVNIRAFVNCLLLNSLLQAYPL